MSSPEAGGRAETLLAVARAAVEHGLRSAGRLQPDPKAYDPELRIPGATFVTLRIEAKLRGCTGSLEAFHPLVVDVAHNAHRSAFEDSRFPAVACAEAPLLAYHISILSPLEPLAAASEPALLASLRPGVDGLVLVENSARSTFLPAVWESLPSPVRFLEELKRKAELPPDYWSPTLLFQRYTVEDFGDPDG